MCGIIIARSRMRSEIIVSAKLAAEFKTGEMSRLFIAVAPPFSSLEAFSAEVQHGSIGGRVFPQAVKAKCRYHRVMVKWGK